MTISALKLKERIAMETKRLTEGVYDDYRTPNKSPKAYSRPEVMRPSHRHHPPHLAQPPSTDLPGVRSIHDHALEAERARREEAAALKIQAAYRGYQVRKSLQWTLPSGRTMGAALKASRVGDGVEVESESESEGDTNSQQGVKPPLVSHPDVTSPPSVIVSQVSTS